LPGVAAASAINHLPLAGDVWGRTYEVEGRPLPPGDAPRAAFRVVLPGYFDTVNLRLIAGRDVDDRDTIDAPPVVIVNEWIARREWPGEDPLGKRIHPPGDPGSAATVIGVAANAVRGDWTEPPGGELYYPYLQTPLLMRNPGAPFANMTFVVRAEGDPAAIGPAVRKAIRSVARDVTLSEELLMRDVAAEATAGTRFLTTLLGAFATVALALAAIGVYGVMSYTVEGRRREIGIRLALGASQRGVLISVVRSGVALATVGIGIGLAGAWALGGLIGAVLYGVPPGDPLVFASVTAALAGVTVLASFLPAWRASRVEPLRELR
jgi:putative ABC transport system permease protein